MALIGGLVVILSGSVIEGRVLPRGNVGNQGSPLLLGPNADNGGGATTASAVKETSTSTSNNDDSDNENNDENNADTTYTTSSASPSATATQSSSSTTSTSTGTSSNNQSTTSSPKTTSVSESSIPTSQSHDNKNTILPTDPPKQPSSIRYLVPVFLLIVITLAGFGYQKYRKRKKRRNRSSMAGKDFEKLMRNGQDPFGDLPVPPNNKGWKEIPSNDHDDDDGDEGIWDDKMDEEDAQHIQWDRGFYPKDATVSTGAGEGGGLIKSGQFVSATSKGWGWKESWNNFKSARGKDDSQDQFSHDVEQGELETRGGLEKRPTIKLVQSKLTSEATFTNIPVTMNHQAGVHGYEQVDHEDSNIDQLRHKLASITGTTDPTSNNGRNRLERNKSPNVGPPSQPTQVQAQHSMPEAPEWIRSRSVSPTNLNILSPPMQPHLFFQNSPAPTTSGRKNEPEPSFISEYSEMDDNTVYTLSQCNTPIIPSPNPEIDTTSTSSSNTDKTTEEKQETPKSKVVDGNSKNKMPRIPSTASGLAGIDSFSVVSTNKVNTPKKKGYTSSGLNPIPSPSKERSTSPLALRRSTAIKNLSNPPSGSPSKLGKQNLLLSPPSNPSSGASDRSSQGTKVDKKSRVKKKEAKANNQVEDMLKASWSDRALTSPPLGSNNQSQTQGFVVPGMMSPGLDSGGNGIEQRLALLRNVEL